MEAFYSTRGLSCGASAPEAVLRGIAPDGGLYIRNELPRIDYRELVGADFKQLAKRVLGAFLEGFTQQEIDDCVELAYDNRFDNEEITPMVKLGDMHLLELFHGPTAAFKDVALSILPRLMQVAMAKTGEENEILILTATSGDTGSAALMGFRDVPGIRIIVFYPEKGISPIQRAQMTGMQGSNISVCAVKGNFDDAQTGVKRVFAQMPEAFCKQQKIKLSSANSINIGRLAPQLVYYYKAYLELLKKGEIQAGDAVDFCVPTGNFGDILAGYYAKRMGLPIGRLICASNANDVLTDFINKGVYDKRRIFHITSSPSMDILVSSNLERLIYDALGKDAKMVLEKMEALQRDGHYALDEGAMARIRADFAAESVSDMQAAQTIKQVFEQSHYLLDPHSAVAWCAAQRLREKEKSAAPCVVLSTASPYKFPQSVLDALGKAAGDDAGEQLHALTQLAGEGLPASLEGVLTREARFKDVIEPESMLDYVMRRAAKK